MDLEILFSMAGTLAMAGWIVLLFYRLNPKWVTIISGVTIPIIISIGYCALFISSAGDAQGGFDSLANVALLFEDKTKLLAGWVHYLAFDLLVGYWIMKRGTEEKISYWLILPCLPLTLMFGPAGFLLFHAIRLGRRMVTGKTITGAAIN